MNRKDALATAVLCRAVARKAQKTAEAKIRAGTNASVALTAKIEARLTRGEPTLASPTASILSEPVVAELVRRLGVKREDFERHLLEIAHEAIVEGVPLGDQLIEESPELLGIIHQVKRNIVDELEPIERAGSIKVIASVDLTRVKVA